MGTAYDQQRKPCFCIISGRMNPYVTYLGNFYSNCNLKSSKQWALGISLDITLWVKTNDESTEKSCCPQGFLAKPAVPLFSTGGFVCLSALITLSLNSTSSVMIYFQLYAPFWPQILTPVVSDKLPSTTYFFSTGFSFLRIADTEQPLVLCYLAKGHHSGAVFWGNRCLCSNGFCFNALKICILM